MEGLVKCSCGCNRYVTKEEQSRMDGEGSIHISNSFQPTNTSGGGE